MDCCGINGGASAPATVSANDATPPVSLARAGTFTNGPGTLDWKRAGALCAAALVALVALVPKCPACWSVYAGLSSLLGVSISLDRRYLEPLTLLCLGVALLGVASGVRRTGYLPLWVAAASALGIWLGKFVLQNDTLAYAASCGLVLAALASRRARRRARSLARASELAHHAQAG